MKSEDSVCCLYAPAEKMGNVHTCMHCRDEKSSWANLIPLCLVLHLNECFLSKLELLHHWLLTFSSTFRFSVVYFLLFLRSPHLQHAYLFYEIVKETFVSEYETHLYQFSHQLECSGCVSPMNSISHWKSYFL